MLRTIKTPWKKAGKRSIIITAGAVIGALSVLGVFTCLTAAFGAIPIDTEDAIVADSSEEVGEDMIFQVGEYGAVGDGTTDDGPAIRSAVAAAINAGPGAKVLFEQKRYRLARTETNYHFELEGVTGLTIEGNGAELINNPWNNIFMLDQCEDVTVRGFVIDCDPLPFTQGTITEVDVDQGMFLLEIHEGYDNPVEVYDRIGTTNPNWGWGVCIDPVERSRKLDVIMHLFIDTVTRANDDNLLRVQLRDDYSEHAHDLAPGDRFVITMNLKRAVELVSSATVLVFLCSWRSCLAISLPTIL